MKYISKLILSLTSISVGGLLPIVPAFGAIPVDLRHQSNLSLKAEQGSSFKTISTHQDFKHHQHVRLKQMYQGYPVWGADIIQHSTGRMNGLIYQGLNIDLPVALPSESILANQQQAAIREATTLYQHQNKNKTVVILKTKANRLVYIDKSNKAHWAFYIEFLTQNEKKLEQPVYILDANTYQIYQSWNNLHTLDDELEKVTGGGFGGNSKVGTKVYDSTTPHAPTFNILRNANTGVCYLKGSAAAPETANIFFAVNNGSHMLDLEPLPPIPVQYDCKEKNPEHRGIYWNDDITFASDNDAFFYANLTNKMYILWQKTPVVLNPGEPDEEGYSDVLPIQVYTHLKMSNASWIGALKAIMFGDGDDNEFAPFTSLDIVAHELSHGFTEQNSDLVYSGQSGGLNEAFSDMGGVAATYFLNGQTTWKIGSDIMLTGDALRYVDNPRRDCVGKKPYLEIGGYKIRNCSIDHMKDYKDGNAEILGTQVPYVDVHLSSGIFNKAFYLIAQGWGGDKNAGTSKAFNVMAHANRGYWTSNTSFADGACGVIDATHDYGYDETVVTKAFAAVGIDVTKC
ncbi:MAG: M4 family metallopeptidase [Gammaproteobacteria bacterium]